MTNNLQEAIVLTRSNGVGNVMTKHVRQATQTAQFAKNQGFIISERFAFDVGNNDVNGLAGMMTFLLRYFRSHPNVRHLIVAKPTRICRSYSLYEMFDNLLSELGVSIEAPEFDEEEENI